jgi:hypothetical protein
MSLHTLEAIPIERQCERHKVRVDDELLVPFTDRGLADQGLLFGGQEVRILVIKVGERCRVFLVFGGNPFLVAILDRGLDFALVFARGPADAMQSRGATYRDLLMAVVPFFIFCC